MLPRKKLQLGGVDTRIRGKVLPILAIITIIANISYFIFSTQFSSSSAGKLDPKQQGLFCVNEKSILDATQPTERITVTLLNWKRLMNLKEIVRHLFHTKRFRPFIKEVIIWNNNYNMTLYESDFDIPLQDKVKSKDPADDENRMELRIFNSPSNMYFLARFLACQMGTTNICFFQDDDWKVWPMKSLYMNYMRFPNVLHTDTNAFVHYLSWEWSFFNKEVDMHTGFSWVGTGAIVSKENVNHFFRQMDKMKVDASANIYADMYFSTWLNSMPYQISNFLGELDQVGGFSSVQGGIKRNKDYMYIAAKAMFEQLKTGDDEVFNREDRAPVYEDRDVRSPCFTDECLFLTNMNTFPSVRYLTYEPHMDIDAIERNHHELYSFEFWVKYPYHHAVDNNLQSCWKTTRSPGVGDYFGLDLFEVYRHRYITVRVAHRNQEDLELHISRDAIEWELFPPGAYTVQNQQVSDTHQNLIYDLHSPKPEWVKQQRDKDIPLRSFRFFRFQCAGSCPDNFEVCDLMSLKDSLEVDRDAIDASKVNDGFE